MLTPVTVAILSATLPPKLEVQYWPSSCTTSHFARITPQQWLASHHNGRLGAMRLNAIKVTNSCLVKLFDQGEQGWLVNSTCLMPKP